VTLDTTSLTDGTHQISWSVTDTCGRQSWIGSRLVTVRNTSAVLPVRSAAEVGTSLSSLAVNWDPIAVQTRSETGRLVYPNAAGARSVQIFQGDKIGVQLSDVWLRGHRYIMP